MTQTDPRALEREQVDVWLAFCDEVPEPSLDAYRDLLSDDERKRVDGFRNAPDRQRALVTRALVRTVLSRYAPVPPEAWAFAPNRHGRPAIAGARDLAAGIAFNVSHTRNAIAMAVTRDRDVGVDVEAADRKVTPDLDRRFFAPDESRSIAALPAERRPERFIELWTLKEAYMKARGMGFSLPLRECVFDLRTDGRIVMQAAPSGDDPHGWELWQLRVREQLVVAVCAGRVGRERSRLSMLHVVPLQAPRPLETKLLRASA